MSPESAATRVYAMPFSRGSYQFLTERVGVRARQERKDALSYAVLNSDVAFTDAPGGRWLADGKLRVTEARLGKDQRSAYIRLETTDKMTGVNLRSLAKTGSLRLRLSVSIAVRQEVIAVLPAAVLPAVPSFRPEGNRLSRQFEIRIALKPTDLEFLQWKMNEVVQEKYKQGFRVRNASWTGSMWNTFGGGRVAEVIAGQTGGYCQEFMRLGNEWTWPFVRDLFGPEVMVSYVMAADRHDVMNNHVATMVILSSGDRYILDYWMSLKHELSREPQVFSTLDSWLTSVNLVVYNMTWVSRKDIVPSFGEDMQQLSQLVKEHGSKEGIGLYESYPISPRPDIAEVQRRRRLIVESFKRSPW